MRAIFSFIVIFISVSCCNGYTLLSGSDNGEMKFKVSFPDIVAEKSYTPSTTALPTTSFNVNIKEMFLILSDSNDIVQYVNTIPSTTYSNILSMEYTYSNIPVGTYTATIIANAMQDNIDKYGYSKGWNSATLVGNNINTLILNLVTNQNYVSATGETGYTAYQPPAELFISSQPNVKIKPDCINNINDLFYLTRIVSLVRVRIDKSKNGNSIINFTHSKSDLRIRNVTVSYNIGTGTNLNSIATNVIYVGGPNVYKTSEPASGYAGGTILDVPNNITVWSEAVILPTGLSSNIDEKFNIVISGMAPVGYVPLGSSSPLSTPTIVYWSSKVQQAATPNNILELKCELNSKGATSLAFAGSYGSINITESIIIWQAIFDNTIPF